MNANIIPIQFSQGTSPTFAKTVYVNTTSPTTATIFDLNNPPTTNDNTLKSDSNNIYIGTDGSTWTYNSSTSTYSTYTYPTTVPYGMFSQRQLGFSVPHNTKTKITGYTTGNNTNSTSWDANTGEFTIQRTGWYDISGALMYGAGSWNANTSNVLHIEKNGNTVSSGLSQVTAAITSNFVSAVAVNAKLYLSQGDKISLAAYQNSGSTKATHSAALNTFSIVEIK